MYFLPRRDAPCQRQLVDLQLDEVRLRSETVAAAAGVLDGLAAAALRGPGRAQRGEWLRLLRIAQLTLAAPDGTSLALRRRALHALGAVAQAGASGRGPSSPAARDGQPGQLPSPRSPRRGARRAEVARSIRLHRPADWGMATPPSPGRCQAPVTEGVTEADLIQALGGDPLMARVLRADTDSDGDGVVTAEEWLRRISTTCAAQGTSAAESLIAWIERNAVNAKWRGAFDPLRGGSAPPFIESQRWHGRLCGYAFTNGGNGLGYYLLHGPLPACHRRHKGGAAYRLQRHAHFRARGAWTLLLTVACAARRIAGPHWRPRSPRGSEGAAASGEQLGEYSPAPRAAVMFPFSPRRRRPQRLAPPRPQPLAVHAKELAAAGGALRQLLLSFFASPSEAGSARGGCSSSGRRSPRGYGALHGLPSPRRVHINPSPTLGSPHVAPGGAAPGSPASAASPGSPRRCGGGRADRSFPQYATPRGALGILSEIDAARAAR
eukprot:TRINITY_DN6455_c0_g1_i1.p1 TRINITY_DN6455_c0_g1~~TRINITY_DN6455_c0_g1_i1.p1  ORF type:complete len:493 (+),score=122.83 TRINITY_DN6455_c0_g1_i1:71-1549(+)